MVCYTSKKFATEFPAFMLWKWNSWLNPQFCINPNEYDEVIGCALKKFQMNARFRKIFQLASNTI